MIAPAADSANGPAGDVSDDCVASPALTIEPPRAGGQVGEAIIAVEAVRGCTHVTQLRAGSPLKLLVPRQGGPAAWAYVSSYGGGMVEGDHVTVRATVNRDATLLLGTQASTKIYGCPNGRTSVQELELAVGSGGLLVSTPDPLTCFAAAQFEQRQRVKLTSDASLVLLDWLTAGRAARGEVWALRRYQNRCEVFIDEKMTVYDALRLDPDDGPLDAPHRLGLFNCIASMLVIGPRVKAVADAMLEASRQIEVQRQVDLIWSASPIRGGAILKAAGLTTERVAAFLRQFLNGLSTQLGENPWERRW